MPRPSCMALQSNRDTEHTDLSAVLASLCRGHVVTLQWTPSHCNMPGNEAADSLAKEGTTKEQVDRSTSYPEVKTILKAKQHSKLGHGHPRYNKADPCYLLTRREQVTVFRLRTGHNRFNYHLYSKLRIGHTEQCPCGTGSQRTEHLLQSCPIYEPLRKGTWLDSTPVARKLYRSLGDLRCTATFIEDTGQLSEHQGHSHWNQTVECTSVSIRPSFEQIGSQVSWYMTTSHV